MPKSAPGRNDPCPCGSGKKYKKCCFGTEPVAHAPVPAPDRSAWDRLPIAERAKIAKEVQRLDDLSNGAMDAMEAKRYDDAERLCADLLREYPLMIDGHERLGMLREAQGRFHEAADHYAKALALIEQDPQSCPPEVSEELRERRQRALAKAAPPV